MDRAAIIGVGMTKIEKNKVRETFADMAWEAVNKALNDAGMTIADIDNVVTTSSDFWDGRTISCMAVGDASGAAHKNVSCVEGDGAYGALYGMTRCLSGSYKTTLVTGHSKGSEGVSSLITNAAFDPIYERALGLDMVTACALQARAYMHRTGTTEEQLALVSVKNHGNALKNPLTQLPLKITVQDVLASEPIADPLHKLDCSPVSDGCAAVIIAHESVATRFRQRPVWIRGVSFCADSFFLGDRNLSRARALAAAAKKAYAMADINDPKKEIDVVELHDAFTYQELLWLEEMGLAEAATAGKLLEKGDFDRNGRLPVNASGGLLSGHPVIAAGLYSLAAVVRQIRGDAGGFQVKKAKTGLAHGVNGLAGQSHCVFILDRDK
ncbi:MAG: thiolase family protein [Syntrophobacterales bacterium]|nr:thiolase family protein [Syntrophobacterales bacterium]